jgi:hypothetical protein
MKLAMWVLMGSSVIGVSFWLIIVTQANPIPVSVFVLADAAATVGAIWMMESATREETHPGPVIWLAFLPFSFLWYYFERVRPLREIKLPRRRRSNVGVVGKKLPRTG